MDEERMRPETMVGVSVLRFRPVTLTRPTVSSPEALKAKAMHIKVKARDSLDSQGPVLQRQGQGNIIPKLPVKIRLQKKNNNGRIFPKTSAVIAGTSL